MRRALNSEEKLEDALAAVGQVHETLPKRAAPV